MAEQSTDTPPAEAQGDSVEVRDVDLPEVTDTSTQSAPGQMDILLDSTMPITASLGEVSIPVRDLLQLGPGSVVKLDRVVGEPIDLFLHGRPFAKGQLVVVEERLAVRIQEILAPEATAAADGA